MTTSCFFPYHHPTVCQTSTNSLVAFMHCKNGSHGPKSRQILLGTHQRAHSSLLIWLDVRFLRLTTTEFLMLHSTKSYLWISMSMLSLNPITNTSAHPGISVPTHLRHWGHGQNGRLCTWWLLRWLCKFCFLWHHSEKHLQTTKSSNLLARVVTNSFQSSSHTLLQQLHWLPAEYHINLEIAMSLSIQHIPRSVLTYFRPCMLIIQLAPSGCPAPICSRFHSYALHSAPTASVLQAP